LALIFFTGGESGLPEFTSSSAGIVCSTAQKKSGNYSIKLWSTGTSFTQLFPAKTDFYLSYQAYPSTWGSGGRPSWCLQNSGTNIIYWNHPSDTNTNFYLGNGTLIGSLTTRMYAATRWYLVEIHIIVHSTNGLVNVRIDGIDEITWTGNTAVSGPAIDRWYANSSYTDFYLDDIIINDTTGTINNSWMGGCKIEALSPIGPGSSTQWNPSTGANWDCVNEVPISETDYVTSNLAGALDLYDLASLPAGVSTASQFLGLKVLNAIARTGTTISYIKNSLRTNSSDVFSDPVTVPTSLLFQSTTWEINPVSGTTWTYMDINALEAGVKVA